MTTLTDVNDDEIELVQEAYVISSDKYQAHGVLTRDGKKYDVIVTWDVVNFETENEDETCDWDDFTYEII